MGSSALLTTGHAYALLLKKNDGHIETLQYYSFKQMSTENVTPPLRFMGRARQAIIPTDLPTRPPCKRRNCPLRNFTTDE